MRQGIVVALSAAVVSILGFTLGRRVAGEPPPIEPPPSPPPGTAVALTIVPVNVPTDTTYVLDWRMVGPTGAGVRPTPYDALAEGASVYFPGNVIVPGRLRTYKQATDGNFVHSMDGPDNWSPADGTTWVWDMANPLRAPIYVPPA